MKKNKILIIFLILGILFLTSYLYNSYATSTGVSLGNDENTYDILLNDSTDTVSVPAKSSKTIYYQFSNTNKGSINYHIGYSSNNVIAKVWWDTEDFVSGTIDQGVTKFIKLKLINESTEDDTITIKPVLGYVNGGDLVVPNDTNLVTGTINVANTWNKLVPVDKSTIKEIYFVDDNIVPADALGSANGNTDGSIKTWYTSSDTENMYKVYIGSDNGITSFPVDCYQLFMNYSSLMILVFNYVDTSKVGSTSSMFQGLNKLTKLDLSNFNTSNVGNMSNMFYNCSGLTTLDLSNFDTSKVSTMRNMFYNCSGLTTLNLSNFNTSNVTSMENMFYNCGKLTSLDLNSFNTPLLRNTKNMFFGCSKISTLNLRNLETSIVTDMYGMFSGCGSLDVLDLSNFNTSSVWDARNLFSGCSKLKTIYLDKADLSGITSNYTRMFFLVPTTVNIYLKDTQGNRDFMSNNFSSYTNVQYIPSS